MRRPPIASNIPEGTLWPDLDDAARIRAERMQKLIDETYSRPFAALKETPPDLSYEAQLRAYQRVCLDPFVQLGCARVDRPQTGTRNPNAIVRLE